MLAFYFQKKNNNYITNSLIRKSHIMQSTWIYNMIWQHMFIILTV